MRDCLIIGGGAIGLSLAYELSRQGRSALVVDRRQPGREASWAGAGLLPPSLSRIGHSALDSMLPMSNRLHEEWAARLRAETGIDNEYRRCGALLLATTEEIRTGLRKDAEHWRRRGIRLEPIEIRAIADLEPALDCRELLEAYFSPDEAQLRNPRHLKALMAACQQRGVEILSGVEVSGFERQGDRILAATSAGRRFEAQQFCICGGAWSTPLLQYFGLPLSIRPIRGQIVLLKLDRQVLRHVIYDGPHYLVPRADGHVLVGSTVEDVGFDTHTTNEAIERMLEFAYRIAPQLSEASVEQSWAGLRPATKDGLPYLDRVPDTINCFVATGHFRCGLQLSTSTAVLMRQLLFDEPLEIDLSPFSLARDFMQPNSPFGPN
jgi:glycine oxidase